MKIVYILKQDVEGTLKELMDGHRENNEVSVIDLRECKEYDRIIDLVMTGDRVICW